MCIISIIFHSIFSLPTTIIDICVCFRVARISPCHQWERASWNLELEFHAIGDRQGRTPSTNFSKFKTFKTEPWATSMFFGKYSYMNECKVTSVWYMCSLVSTRCRSVDLWPFCDSNQHLLRQIYMNDLISGCPSVVEQKITSWRT